MHKRGYVWPVFRSILPLHNHSTPWLLVEQTRSMRKQLSLPYLHHLLMLLLEATEDSWSLPRHVRRQPFPNLSPTDKISIALCWYEHAITFGEEVRCVWRKRISVASVLFLLNRYLTLVSSTVNMVQLLPWQSRPEGPRYPYLVVPDKPYDKVSEFRFCSEGPSN